jgi:hypothetical protein
MTITHNSIRPFAGAALAAVALAGTHSAAASTTPPAPATYTSTTFAIPFEVTLPDWLPPDSGPTAERPNFVKWESADGERAVRFLVPMSVVEPGGTTRVEVPDDYVAHLLSFGDVGASFDEPIETTVDGYPATIVTATTSEEFHGALGCDSDGTSSFGECAGLIPDTTLHIAVIDTGDLTLLVWERDAGVDGDVDYSSFDAMLASLHFRDEAPPATGPADLASPMDGMWTTTVTMDELADSPLLYDAGEINDQNWGDLTFTFDSGRFTETQHNAAAVWAGTGTYDIDGDVITINRDNGEQFVMRWHIGGDALVLERDDTIGAAPTPWIINPWTRQS